MNRKTTMVLFGVGAFGAAYATGLLNGVVSHFAHDGKSASKSHHAAEVDAPAVSVVRVAPADFVETVLVTGSLVAREEITVAPEVEGLKVLDIRVDQGDEVKKGQVLATLVTEALEAQIAQNEASLARSVAAIAQAKSVITEVEARLSEAKASLERAQPLNKSGYLAESVLDQRRAAEQTATAQLAAARDGLRAAEAEKHQIEAQRRELDWKLGNAEVKAPADGIISRRGARIGAIAIGAMMGSGGEPMFRIIKDGAVELDAEVTEGQIAKLKVGQTASIKVTGNIDVEGKVRLISPEIDPLARLGRVRVYIGKNERLRIGAFATGVIEAGRSNGLAVPVTAVSYAPDGATVQVVDTDKVETRHVKLGLKAGGLVEIVGGLKDGDMIVSRAGTFLRDGDRVRPVSPAAEKISEAQ